MWPLHPVMSALKSASSFLDLGPCNSAVCHDKTPGTMCRQLLVHFYAKLIISCLQLHIWPDQKAKRVVSNLSTNSCHKNIPIYQNIKRVFSFFRKTSSLFTARIEASCPSASTVHLNNEKVTERDKSCCHHWDLRFRYEAVNGVR